MGFAGDNDNNSFVFGGTFQALSNNSINYHPFWAPRDWSSVESNFQVEFFKNFTVTRMTLRCFTFSKTGGDTFESFRDDSSNVVTIEVDGTGNYDSGAINVEVASGSLINFLLDTSTETGGSIALYAITVLCEH